MDDRKGNVVTHKGKRYGGSKQKTDTPDPPSGGNYLDSSKTSPTFKGPDLHFRANLGRTRLVTGGKNAVPPFTDPTRKVFLAEDVGRIVWEAWGEDFEIDVRWRRACALVRREKLNLPASSVFACLYQDFITRLELVAKRERPQAGGTIPLRLMARGAIPEEGDGFGTLIKFCVLGEEFVLPEPYFNDCGLPSTDLSTPK